MTKQQLASAFYRQGIDALEQRNWSLAVELFQQCARLVPDNIMYCRLAEKCSEKRNSRL